jgi:hypothetical protein
MKVNKKIFEFPVVGDGMNQKVTPTMLRYSEAQLLYNITTEMPGVWRTRKGDDLLATAIAGDQEVKGLGTYIPQTGVQQLFMVANTNLYKYDGNVTFSLVEALVTASNEDVNFVNYGELNRLYMFTDSSTTYVKYTSGTTTTEVGGAGKFKAKYGAVAQGVMWYGGIPSYENRVYVSRIDETTNLPVDTPWESDETGITDSTRFFILDGPCMGLCSYRDRLYAFTDRSCWMLNAGVTPVEGSRVFNIGTTAHRSIQVDEKTNVMLWANENGIYMYAGGGDPMNVIEKITNRTSSAAVWDLISPANFDDFTAGAWDGKYILAVGNLTDTAQTYYANCGIEYNIISNTIQIREFPAAVTTLFTKSGDRRLYYGDNAHRAVFRIGVGSVDYNYLGNTNAYSGVIRTKRLKGEFGGGSGARAKEFHTLILVHEGTGNITVKYAVNGATTYSTLATITASTTETTAIVPMGAIEGHDISFEFSVASGTMEIKGFGVEATITDSFRLPIS